MTYNILIKFGTIIDGSDKPRFHGDIGIADGYIKAIGNPSLNGATAEKIIDAGNKFVTPGFIDLTNHADTNLSLFRNPGQSHLLTQGISTIVVGNCGSSLAPLLSVSAINSLRKWDRQGVNINWQTVAELLQTLAKSSLGLNVATLIGHGTIRRGLIRDESRPLSAEELGEVATSIEQGISQGAFGLSLGLVYAHEMAANHKELVTMASTIHMADGVLKVHLRNESHNLLSAVNEMVQIARESKATIILSHLKAIGRRSWPSFRKIIEMIDRARETGVRLSFDVSPYQRTGSFLYLLIPAWAREGGFDMMLKRIEDTANRKAIVEAMERETLHYEKLVVANAETPNTNGRTIQELAERSGMPAAETLLDLIVTNRGRVIIFGQTLSFRNIVLGLTHPAAMAASDGTGIFDDRERGDTLLHPRSTGAFPHFLHRFIKEKELMSWEDGIRKITSLPASTVGLKDRGRIAEGFRADVVIFDPATIRDRSTYQNPYVHSTGIEAFVVNGKLAIEKGQLTGVTAGQMLKKS